MDDFGAVATNMRLLVWNRGRTAAQRVELTVADVCQRSKEGSLKLITDFLPTALKWTHTEAPRCEYLGPDAKRLCNLGSFLDTPAIDVAPVSRPAGQCFVFATEIQPRSGYNRLERGIYVVRIVATALNCKPDVVTLVINVGPHLLEGKASSFSIFDAPDEVVAEVDRLVL